MQKLLPRSQRPLRGLKHEIESSVAAPPAQSKSVTISLLLIMSTDTQTLDLKKTVNLPKTKFGQKANLPQTEPARLKKWADMQLYEQIRKARAGAEKFILHDGPPYANADIHLGTALNKILKDFIVKSRTMLGYDAPYVPGYDCHGLPI